MLSQSVVRCAEASASSRSALPATVISHPSLVVVTAHVSIVHTVPLEDKTISPLSQSLRTGSASILSYIAFLVGTSIVPFHPAQYTSSGTLISHVKVAHDNSALSLFKFSIELLYLAMNSQSVSIAESRILYIVDILDMCSYCIKCWFCS